MREIEFRGKDINSGEWVYGDLHLLCDKPHIHTAVSSYPFAGERSFVSMQTIGQFIGKRDKNGRKIYEGDIVTLDGPNSKYVFEVIFDKKTAGFKMKGRYCHVVTDLECEVIGNIHDNPEFNNQISN